MAAISFQGARMPWVQHLTEDGKPITRIKIVATALEDLAIRLAVPWLHRAKAGLLEELEKGASVTHEVARIHKLITTARYVGRFRAFRDKSETRVVGVSFIVECAGHAFETLEHKLSIGEGAGVCSIEALQKELFEEEPVEKHLRGEALARHRRMTESQA